MLQQGVMPYEAEKQDFIELMKILDAKPREERPQPTEDAFNNLAKMLNL